MNSMNYVLPITKIDVRYTKPFSVPDNTTKYGTGDDRSQSNTMFPSAYGRSSGVAVNNFDAVQSLTRTGPIMSVDELDCTCRAILTWATHQLMRCNSE